MEPNVVEGIVSEGTWTGAVAVVFAWGVNVCVPVVMAGLALTRAWAAREAARQARRVVLRHRDHDRLTEGAAILYGRVEREKGAEVALKVEIHQRGTEHKDGYGWSHRFIEFSRSVVAHPFYVRDGRGRRVRVEPDQETLLVDTLDVTEGTGQTTRKRVAELSEDEEVYVRGELVRAPDPLAGGYRDSDALVMRAPRAGRLLVSALPLDEPFRQLARQEAWRGLGFAVVLVLLLALGGGYHGRVFFGERETATIERMDVVSGKQDVCSLHLVLDGGARVTESVSRSWCSRLRSGDRVPVIYAGEHSVLQVGDSPGVHFLVALLGFVLVAGGTGLYVARARPWYERPLVETAKGRLPGAPT